MKKVLTKFCVFLAALSLAACNKNPAKPSESEPSEESTITDSQKENHDVLDVDLGDAPTYQEPSIQFHYWRKDGKYQYWNMWLWEGGKDGGRFDFNGKDEWGVVASYPLSTWVSPFANQLGFIIRQSTPSNEWAQKDCGGNDLFVDFDLYNKDENDVYHIYMITGDSNLYLDTEGNMRGKITDCSFTTEKNLMIKANLPIVKAKVFADEELVYNNESVGKVKRIDVPFQENIDFTKSYRVELSLNNGDELKQVASFSRLFSSQGFNDAFYYDGELGAIYTKAKTTFKVWSPLSTKIMLRIYNSGTEGEDAHEEYEMVKGDKGVFSYEVEGDLGGKYYTYVVTNALYKDKEIVDPYAKSAGVNGRRGMVVDFSETNPMGWEAVTPIDYDRKELVVYETHVADVTSSKTWTGLESGRKLFNGMIERGTTYTDNNNVTVSTGFDHIAEMGVNAVQIIPLFDQANDEENMTFNWGYNPLNYNCVEGGYSSDPYDGYVRIREFKKVVQEFNKEGINIIMDVVYNHVNSVTGLCFDVLMPEYYFRYKNGALSNGSGCGNETASENLMMRKYIVDSTKFWAEEYKLGGFRFDLMGLHDLTTMKEVAAEAKKINPNIVIYGEPWRGGDSTLPEIEQAIQKNGNNYEGYGAFNDQLRDALIKGGMNAATDLGWIADTTANIAKADANKILRGMQGVTKTSAIEIADPDKTVNYVTCHDNYTLYDRFIATTKFTAEDEELLKKMNVLSNAVALLSQGTSFMLAGEEFLRTKQGSHNSYNESYEVNELDYALKAKHLDMVETYKKIIDVKTRHELMHLDKVETEKYAPTMSATASYIEYRLGEHEELVILHANGVGATTKFDLSDYEIYLSTTNPDKVASNEVTLDRYETIVAMKKSS